MSFKAWTLFSVCLFLAFLTGACHFGENNHLTCVDFARHMVDSGIQVEALQPLQPGYGASDALSVKVAGRNIGIYKFNVNVKLEADSLANCKKSGFVCISTLKYPALFNGSFMFVCWESNPKKKEIVKAIESF